MTREPKRAKSDRVKPSSKTLASGLDGKIKVSGDVSRKDLGGGGGGGKKKLLRKENSM